MPVDTTLLNQPYNWLRQIPEDLWTLDETPLLGYSPEFPWTQVAAHIAKSLELNALEIKPSEWQWRTQEELFTGLGTELKCLTLNLPPLVGPFYWVMPETEAKRLANLLITHNLSTPLEYTDEAFYKGIERFLTAEVLSACEKVFFNSKLSPCIIDNKELPSEHSLCLDVTIQQAQEVIHGRLILSNTFRKSWKQHFDKRPDPLLSNSSLAEKIDTIVHLEAGKVRLSLAEWKNIHLGDLILLDSCSLDADEDKGRIMLVVNGIPFFRAKIKQGSVKILEHPLYHEVDIDMTSPTNHDDEDDDLDDFSTDDFSDDDLSDLSDDESHTSDDDSEIEEIAKKEPPAKTKEESPPVATTPNQNTDKAQTALEDVPLSIVVEVGRLQMSIKKLMELQPGNMLDLNIHPEAGVDLVLNGKRVAKGELLRIGETLGVRIVEFS